MHPVSTVKVRALPANLPEQLTYDLSPLVDYDTTITLADVCLAGQVVGSGFFQTDMKPYPTVQRIFDTCMQNEAFAKAHPLKQPGAPESV